MKPRDEPIWTTPPMDPESRTSSRGRASLDLDPDSFGRLGHRLVDLVAAWLGDLPHRPVTSDTAPRELRRRLGANDPLPVSGEPAERVFASTTELLFEHSLFNGHPRFFGYVTSSPSPVGILSDFLAAAINANVGAWRLAPVASEIEAQTIRWLAELVGMPAQSGGLLVSGGNMANLVALVAARRAASRWDLRAAGLAAEDAEPLRIYASEATHTWLQKAADIAGLGTDAIRWVPVDRHERVVVPALATQMSLDRKHGDVPMMVVGTAGTVSTGAIDPLHEIADLCGQHDVWFHIDGCYGGVAACTRGAPADLGAVCRADSIALDPHKWLYAPIEAGAILVRDPQRLRDAFAYHPPYYHFGEEALNYVDLGPQNSRAFRALKVWLSLRIWGLQGHARSIEEDIRLARLLAARVDKDPELQWFTCNLSVTTFRFVPADFDPGVLGTGVADPPEVEAYLDRLNEALLDDLQRGGEVFVSHAIVQGRYALRACIVNFRTTEADIEALVQTVVRRGRSLDAENRPGTRLPSGTGGASVEP